MYAFHGHPSGNFSVIIHDQRRGRSRGNLLQPRSVTIGSAYETGKWLFAADAVDLTRAYSNVQGRIGMEYSTRKVSFRAGYSSAVGLTAGFGWGWLQLAFGNRAPLDVATTLRF